MSFDFSISGDGMDRDRFMHLVARACEERISDEEFRELERTLKSSREAREIYREYTNLHVTLGGCFGAAAQFDSPRVGDAPPASAGRSEFRRRALLPAAAAVAIGLGIFALMRRGAEESPVTAGASPVPEAADLPAGTGEPARHSDAPAPAAVAAADAKKALPPWRASMPSDGLAVVKDVIGVKWTEKSRRFPKNQWITNQRTVAIEGGLIRIRFRKGATVTLRGPAKLRILSGNSARLEYGEVYSNVPPSAKGFTMITAPVKVIDVGTAFGMTADKDGDVEVHVYEGEVHLRAPDDAPQAFGGMKKLLEGDALRARGTVAPGSDSMAARRTAFEEAEFGAPVFQRLRSVNTGLPTHSKKMQVSDRAPLKHLREYESNGTLFVFQERRRVHLDAPIAVAFCEPGEHYAAEENSLPVGEGATVSSYLLQFNPVGKAKKMHPFKGSITFDQPVVGVITETGRLIETDALFAPELSFYRNFKGRTIERNAEAPPNAKRLGDKVTLSSNRRTLHLDWSASVGIDQIRVLVRDEAF